MAKVKYFVKVRKNGLKISACEIQKGNKYTIASWISYPKTYTTKIDESKDLSKLGRAIEEKTFAQLYLIISGLKFRVNKNG